MSEVFKKFIVELAAVFFLITGCAGTSVVVNQENNKIVMPHYSIELPANQGWSLTNLNKNDETLTLNKKVNSLFCQMVFLRNMLTAQNMKSLNAKQVADDYRESEKANMMVRGVMTGAYELRDVIMGEEFVGNKKFYTMEYETLKDDLLQKAYLYIFFPKEKEIDDFIVAHYSETKSIKEFYKTSYKHEFLETLKRLTIRN